MLDDYIDHFKYTTANKSFLARIYGIFTIQTSQFAPIDFIIQQNTSLCQNNSMKRFTFDLKGNTCKRRADFRVTDSFKMPNERYSKYLKKATKIGKNEVKNQRGNKLIDNERSDPPYIFKKSKLKFREGCTTPVLMDINFIEIDKVV